ncbi:hypothetical protein [Thalassobacter stenotrophicus]|uniref:Uncharacterized protein n=2 Tax=Thalassobacter stenotrophicus TaxID=266809 RepID=A0A0P1FJP4_9RHOB|nr:hypothetical protein [Thalassobacter stenotrophicus]CUH60905.1 hypothetical protein THS5294_02202 [Thalassobacter stenotrophicus]SHI52141.1 hypothetical protein SAMN02744035_00726 [Thalassobacter stenotrophicus DSM 16310]
MKQPKIKSNKQLYRLWFEFLKMAHKEPNLQAGLAASNGFYEQWGDVRDQLFDPWWREHKHLFGTTYVQEVQSVSAADNVMYVAIPLNQPATRSVSDVKALIEDKQRAKLIEQGQDPETVKSLSAAFGKYSFTQGVEIRGKVLYEIQLMYGIWQELGKPAVNTAFITEVVDRLKDRPRSKWTPYLLQIDPMPDKKGNLRYDEGQIRQVRRYLKKGYAVCEAVSKSHFPGASRL